MTRIVIFHTMDPRGRKIGGIETHVRLVLGCHPPEDDILLVGLDEVGDARLGAPIILEFDGRAIEFLPVARIDPEEVNRAARTLWRSVTLRYVLGALWRLPALRAAAGRRGGTSCEIERFEFAVLPKLLGLPCVLMVHNEGTRADKMDSLIKRFWWLHQLNERAAIALADRVFGVNPAIAARVAGFSRSAARKVEAMSVSVDTARFRPVAFPDGEELRVCFAGRLDAFKDPPLMFSCLRLLAERLRRMPAGRFARLAFDYVGATDPFRYAEFNAIAGITTRHGPQPAAAVAAIMARSHLGVITSFFEGLPCYLLEMLASGRPVAAIDLPQFSPFVCPGTSGVLVPRRETQDESAADMAAALATIAEGISDGTFDPARVASLVASSSVAKQMGRLFACHRTLASAA